MRSAIADESGSASVLAAFLVVALVAIAMGAVWIGSAVVARHRAQAAADLAALVAAQRIPAGPAAACRSAGELAVAMGAALTQCAIEQLDVVVTVEVTSVAPIGGRSLASARAGAG